MRFNSLVKLRNNRLNKKILRAFHLYSVSRISQSDKPLGKLSANSERYAFPLKLATGGMILPTTFLPFMILTLWSTWFCVLSRTAFLGRFPFALTAGPLFHDTTFFHDLSQ